MKKLNFLAVLLCVCPMMMFGQLEVQSDGAVIVNNRIRSSYTATTMPMPYYFAAVEGNAYVTGVDASVGVKGYAQNSLYCNIGVYGYINSGKGVGVLGSTNPYAHQSFTQGYAGYFYGDVRITNNLTVATTTYTSDYRYKQNITELNAEKKAVNNLFNLTPVEYNFKQRYIAATDSLGKAVDVGYFDEKSQLFQKKHYGLIAQEVQKLYPDLVYEDGDGYLSIDYIGIIPLLIQTAKEQNATIQGLKAEIDELKGNKPILAKAQQSEQAAILYQNTPNPFNQQTEIGYFIPETVKTANLYVYDLNGVQQRKFSIVERGSGAVILQASALGAGIYVYTLICDGKPVDTKQMILTK